MVLYVRAKIQQKGRNGKRSGLLSGSEAVGSNVVYRQQTAYFSVLLLSCGLVPDLGL